MSHHPEAISFDISDKANGDVFRLTEANTRESLLDYETDIVALPGNQAETEKTNLYLRFMGEILEGSSEFLTPGM